MKKERKDKHFIHKPYYEGGLKAMRAFIKKHQRYPEEARRDRVEGTVVLRYTINIEGKVTGTKIIKSLSPECDAEAIRVVKLLKFQVPKNRRRGLKFHKRIQIHFRLPTETPETNKTDIHYTITPARESEKTSPKEDKGGGYTIEIEW